MAQVDREIQQERQKIAEYEAAAQKLARDTANLSEAERNAKLSELRVGILGKEEADAYERRMQYEEYLRTNHLKSAANAKISARAIGMGHFPRGVSAAGSCSFPYLAPSVATFSLFSAAKRCEGRAASHLAASAALFAAGVTFITFGWIVATIHRYTGQNVLITALLSILYAAFCQLKIALFLILCRYALRAIRFSPIEALAFCAILALCDALTPELFPWSWGNALAAQQFLRQWASVGSVYALSFFAGLGSNT